MLESKGLHYKLPDILEISKKHNINILQGSDESGITTITFASKDDFNKAYSDICIIPINYMIRDLTDLSNN